MKQIFYIHCHSTFRYLLSMLLVVNYTIGFSQDNSSTTLRCGTPLELSEELAQQEAEFAAHQAAQRISARTSATGTALYVRFKFKGEDDPPTVNLDEAKEFFEHSSYGQYTIEFTEVEQVIELPYTRETATDNSNYDFKDDVNEALLNMGYNHNDYDYYLNRSRGGKPVGGTNYSAGHYIQLISKDSWVTCHEIGHSLYKILGIDAFKSLNHANWWKPSVPSQVIGPGSSAEYADKSSIMGNNVGRYADLNFAHKVNLGWLSESEYHRVVDNDVYRIYAHDMNTKQSGRQYGIIVEKNTKALGTSEPEHKYYLEYKIDNPKTPDAYKNGVTMTAFQNNYTQLFDFTPGSADKQRDAPLQVGMSFRDEEAGITIETVEKGGSGPDSWIEVAVEFDNPPGKGAFEVPELAWQSPTPNQQFAEGDEIRLQVDIDGYAEEVWFFKELSDLAVGAYSFIGEDDKEPFEWTVTEDLPPGNYRFGARAVNDVGKSKIIPVTVTIKAESATACSVGPPTAPSQLLATHLSPTKVQVTWQDNSVAENYYLIYRKTAKNSFAIIDTVARNRTSYTDAKNIQPDIAYIYRVQGVSCAGVGNFSEEAPVTSAAARSTYVLQNQAENQYLRYKDESFRLKTLTNSQLDDWSTHKWQVDTTRDGSVVLRHQDSGGYLWYKNGNLHIAYLNDTQVEEWTSHKWQWIDSAQPGWKLMQHQRTGTYLKKREEGTALTMVSSSKEQTSLRWRLVALSTPSATRTDASQTAKLPVPSPDFAFNIYPNPVEPQTGSRLLRIVLPREAPGTVSINDLSGKELLRTIVQKDAQMDVSSLPKGLYLVRVRQTGRSAYQKLVVE